MPDARIDEIQGEIQGQTPAWAVCRQDCIASRATWSWPEVVTIAVAVIGVESKPRSRCIMTAYLYSTFTRPTQYNMGIINCLT